jgi:cobalt-zinc-cadmium efflux system outer membrane protein
MKWLLALALSWPLHAVADDGLTLDAALRVAFERNPSLAQADATVQAALARAVAAGTYPFNPELRGEAGARTGPDDTAADWGIEIGQTIELAGQTGKRESAAQAEIVRARAERDLARRALAARVRLAYLEACRARDLLRIETAQAALARELAGAVERRLEAGAATRLELNVTRTEIGRAEARVRGAEGRYGVARSALSEAIGLAADAATDPTDPLDPPAEAVVLPVPDLLARARVHRAELVALNAARDAARRRVEVAESEAIPDLGLSAFVQREGGRETIVGGGVSVPLPVFDRNQGGVAEARAEMARLGAESAAVALQVESQVVQAAAELAGASGAVVALRGNVATMEESAGLLRQAALAGKIAASELLLVRQQTRDAARELLEAVAEAGRARVFLDLATGNTPLPPDDGKEK